MTDNIDFSFGETIKSNKITNISLDFKGFTEFLSEFKAVEEKTDLAYFTGGQYRDNLRDSKNLLFRSLIVLDIDEYSNTIETFEKELNLFFGEYRYIAHSTFRHTLEKPRFRVILFPTRKIDLNHFTRATKVLASKVHWTIDPCSHNVSHSFFKGGYKLGSDYTPFFKENDGKLIDVDKLLAGVKNINECDDLTSDSRASEISIVDEGFKLPLNLTFEGVQKYLENYTPVDLSYNSWLSTGMMIHHQTAGTLAGRGLWKKWSKKHFKKDSSGRMYTNEDYENDTKSKWISFDANKNNTLTFKAIKKAVDIKNPEISRKLVSTNGRVYNFDELLDVAFIHLTERGVIRSTLENVKLVCDSYGLNVHYNIITNYMDITIIDNELDFNKMQLSNKITFILSLCHQNNFKLSKAALFDFLRLLADKNHYNPIIEFIKSKPWDGVSRLKELYDTVPSDLKMKEFLMRKWFLSAVAAVNEENFKSKGVLVFQSGQSRRKGDWFKSLLPTGLANNYLSEGMTFNAQNKDSIATVIRNWICELGEIDATFRKSDISALKAFISNDKDTFRLPYDTCVSTFKRHTVFYGTVNDAHFLVDSENVRWWVIPLQDSENLNPDHNIDVQQLWAEFQAIYETGERWYLIREEIEELEESNNKHKVLTIQDEILLKIQETYNFEDFDILNWKGYEKKLTSDIYKEINTDGTLPNPNNSTINNTGRALSKLKLKKEGNYWLIPLKKNQPINIF